jgi:hypothetical protein
LALVYKLYRCQRFTTSQLKGPTLGSKWRAKSIPKCALVWRTGHSTVPVRCTRGCRAELLSLGIFQKSARYNSPDCPVYTGQCPVLQEDATLELGSLGNSQWVLRYNSPDMSGVHRTVRCDCGATATSRQRSPAGAFNARQKRAEVRHAHTGAPDIEQYMSGVHRTSRRAQKSELQRSNPNNFGDVAGAPDMSGVHTGHVRCTIRQSAPPNG